MDYYGKLKEARLSDIRPAGWLREMLLTEKNGLPGHLDEIGYPFDKACWTTKEPTESWASNWWPYEQSAYWVDSCVRTAALLDDEALYDKVRAQVEQALAQADPYIGPEVIRGQGPCYRWPHAVFFRALYALWSKTGDRSYLEKMREHFEYDRERFFYGCDRNVIATESMFRVAAETGDEALRDFALGQLDRFLETYGPGSEYFFYYLNGLPAELGPREDTGNMFSDLHAIFHGVSYDETAKIPALAYLYTGRREYLELSKKVLRFIENRHLMADGVNSSGEFLHGRDSQAVHESCDVSDYTWTLGYLLEATGEARYADRIEWAMLNAYPGSLSKDYRSFQYFSCLNQAVAAGNTCMRPDFMDEKLAYQPLHNPQCCAGNLGRALPNFALRFYQETERGAAVSLFGDSAYDGPHIALTQSGGYPYGDECYLDITRVTDGFDELLVRLPGWSVETALLRNGVPADYDTVNGYAKLRVRPGDRLTLRTKKQFESHDNSDGGLYFTYGPFLLSLAIREREEKDTGARLFTEDFPAFALYPASDWAYAVTGYENPLSVRVSDDADAANPYRRAFEIRIKARRLTNWTLAHKHTKVRNQWVGGDRLFTPAIPSPAQIRRGLGDEEEIVLVPYGSTRLRITVFPKYGKNKR